MVEDLNFPVEIVVCPIVREPDGLAMSSRNVYLNLDQRQAAVVLYRSLINAHQGFESGQMNADELRAVVTDAILKEPLAQLQYVSCADPKTLEELDGVIERCLLSLAVFFGEIRLIDNFLLGD